MPDISSLQTLRLAQVCQLACDFPMERPEDSQSGVQRWVIAVIWWIRKEKEATICKVNEVGNFIRCQTRFVKWAEDSQIAACVKCDAITHQNAKVRSEAYKLTIQMLSANKIASLLIWYFARLVESIHTRWKNVIIYPEILLPSSNWSAPRSLHNSILNFTAVSVKFVRARRSKPTGRKREIAMDSWDYEESLDLLDYMPQSNNFLEIWQFEVSTSLNIC